VSCANKYIVNSTDQVLIQQLVSQVPGISEKGWKLIYKDYFPIVRKVILKHNGTEQDAIDIFQDGIIILNRNLRSGKFRCESSVKTYLFSICKNLWLKEFQRQQRLSSIDHNAIYTTPDDIGYLKNVHVVTQLIDKLQEDCRRILVEYYYNNKSMSELKSMFNVNSIQAAKNKKWRCLSYLVKLFKERGITSMEMVNYE
jgi:RNA polymerase sigma factor (sigma-70 family)